MSALCEPLHLHIWGSTHLRLNSWPTFPSLMETILHCQWLIFSIQSILPTAGLSHCYTGHSFCIGTATSAVSCGLPYHITKTFGRLYSNAYQIYICTPIMISAIVGSLITWQVIIISCISFSFPSCFCWVPQNFVSSGPGLPPAPSPEPLFPPLIWHVSAPRVA